MRWEVTSSSKCFPSRRLPRPPDHIEGTALSLWPQPWLPSHTFQRPVGAPRTLPEPLHQPAHPCSPRALSACSPSQAHPLHVTWPPSPHGCDSEVHSAPASALGPARRWRGRVTRKQLLLNEPGSGLNVASRVPQVRVGTQALGHILNLNFPNVDFIQPQFPHLQSGSNIYLASRFVAKIGIYGKCPAGPGHRKCSVNGSCPGQCAQWLQHWLTDRRVTRLIPSQGHAL